MSCTVPLSVRQSQPLSVGAWNYSIWVPFPDPKTYLWDNIRQLMGVPKGENLPIDAVQRRTGVGRGTVQRIRAGEAATQLDSLTAIATKLGVPTWRLLQQGGGLSSRALLLAEMIDEIPDQDDRESCAKLCETLAHLAQAGELAPVLRAFQALSIDGAPTAERPARQLSPSGVIPPTRT